MRTSLPDAAFRLPATLLVLALVLALGAAAGARAEAIADPTRPPQAAPASAAPAPARAASAAPAAPLRLQSVQLPRHGAPSALVDNRLVFVGDKLGGATVLAIDAAGVQLSSARGVVERLRLIDARIVKQAVVPTGTAPAPMASLAGGQQP